MFHKTDDFPSLKGRAAEIRHLVKPLLDACQQILKPDNRVHAQIILALTRMVEVEATLTRHRQLYAFTENVAKRFKRCCEDIISMNALLRRHFEGVLVNDKPCFLFHFTIKFHYALHIADISLYINPRLGWCYQGESLMHRVRILVQASCHGVPAHQLADKVLKKYCQGLAMLLVREQQGGEF